MIEIATIQAILKEHHPPNSSSREGQQDDDDVLDYMLQILQDRDSYEDLDSLVETLSPFWEGQEDAVRQLVEACLRELELSSNKEGAGEHSKAATSAPLLQQPLEPITEQVQSSEINDSPPDESDKTTKKSATKQKKTGRQRRQRKTKKKDTRKNNDDNIDEAQQFLEDEASAWQDCQTTGVNWGGRGRGGRGEYSGAVNSVKSNIHLTAVSLVLPNGTTLLQDATMDIVKGHRYGLIGRNGVGKSSLLRRLSQRAIPGMPADMRILLVQQQINGSQSSAVEVLVAADLDRAALLEEQERLEVQLEETDDPSNVAATVERLGEVAVELDAIGADLAEERAKDILKGLQFTSEMMTGPTCNLSGGWRMRLALARALFVPSDVLLLDEASNHLDLYGLNWLINYLNHQETTLIVVSHDRAFLDAVCTDIVVMHHEKLEYHVGNYSEYTRQQQEKADRESRILDAAERQRTKAQAFVQKQQAQANKKSADPNKQRQAKMIKEKKMTRMGNYREDGKRYKQFSLKQLSEDHVRLAQKVQIEVDERAVKMNFPEPNWPPGVAPGNAIVTMQDFTFGYDEQPLLKEVTLSLSRGSKVALVGRNGCGKSTLVKLVSGEISGQTRHGDLWVHPSVKIGHVTQYSVEELDKFSDQTVAEYADEHLRTKPATASALQVARGSGNIRQYLGAFGLGGKHALQKIGKLSGGERMRLCFATVLANEPNLLLLDEASNHVDIETLETMSEALNNYQGSVLMVSHNQGFLGGFCKELWVLEDGHVTVTHSDTETFDEIFSEYRNSVAGGGGQSLGSKRKEKAHRAKIATKQRVGAKQNTALL